MSRNISNFFVTYTIKCAFFRNFAVLRRGVDRKASIIGTLFKHYHFQYFSQFITFLSFCEPCEIKKVLYTIVFHKKGDSDHFLLGKSGSAMKGNVPSGYHFSIAISS